MVVFMSVKGNEFSEKNFGDRVKVKTKKEDFEGVLMPESGKKTIFIKLDNGYNIGIKKENIESIEIGEARKMHATKAIKEKTVGIEEHKKKATKSAKKNLPIISILHTGGTIASRIDYETGAVKAQFKPEQIIEMVPELEDIAQIRSRLIRNMMSDDMRFAHYNLIAKEIKNEIDEGVDGVIVTHGTDTLHYTAAALSFILENLSIPVLLVGAQRSSDRGSSDAIHNLISAAYFIANSDFAGVAICMHENMSDEYAAILPGCKVRKMHSSRRDAFKAVNAKPIARLNFKEKKIEIADKKYQKKDKNKQTKLMPIKEGLKIGIIQSHPNMFAEELKKLENFDGAVLEGTGLGHMPISKIDEDTAEHEKIFQAIKELCRKSIVVMSTQTIFGRVDMNVYSPGRKLVEAGVLGNYSDMTPETIFIKLAWLLSNFKKEQIIKENLVMKNFRGEIGERTGEEFL